MINPPPEMHDKGKKSAGSAKPIAGGSQLNLASLSAIPLNVSVRLGKISLSIHELLKVQCGDVLLLDKSVGEPADILINDQLFAKGEIVIVENKIGVTITEIIGSSL